MAAVGSQVDPYILPAFRNFVSDESVQFKIHDEVEMITIYVLDEDTGEVTEEEGKMMVFS